MIKDFIEIDRRMLDEVLRLMELEELAKQYKLLHGLIGYLGDWDCCFFMGDFLDTIERAVCEEIICRYIDLFGQRMSD